MSPELSTAFESAGGGELAMLVSQPPIAFHRVFVDLTGSATAALLLSCITEQTETPGAMDDDGWMLASCEQWEVRTGLSRKEQATARKVLRAQHLLEERRDGFPANFRVRVNFERISKRLIEMSQAKFKKNGVIH